MFNPKQNMFFLRNQKRNDKQPLSNFEAEIAVEAKQLEAQPEKVVAYKKKRVTSIQQRMEYMCMMRSPFAHLFIKPSF